MTSLSQILHLKNDQTITKYFPKNKKSFSSIFASKMQRIVHFMQSGIWINKKRICTLANQNLNYNLSAILKDYPLSERVSKCEQGYYVAPLSLTERIKVAFFFLRQKIIGHDVGSVIPSTKTLAKKMVSIVPKIGQQPRTIIEIGAGTGGLTSQLIKRMNTGDQLHLIEYNKDLAEILRKKYANVTGVTIHCMDALQFSLPAGQKCDYLVTSLPLNDFEPKLVKQFFKKFEELGRKNAKMTYMTYMLVPTVKRIFLGKAYHKRINGVLAAKKRFCQKHNAVAAKIYKNIPPTVVTTLTLV